MLNNVLPDKAIQVDVVEVDRFNNMISKLKIFQVINYYFY